VIRGTWSRIRRDRRQPSRRCGGARLLRVCRPDPKKQGSPSLCQQRLSGVAGPSLSTEGRSPRAVFRSIRSVISPGLRYGAVFRPAYFVRGTVGVVVGVVGQYRDSAGARIEPLRVGSPPPSVSTEGRDPGRDPRAIPRLALRVSSPGTRSKATVRGPKLRRNRE